MKWFIFSISALLCWSFSDLFSKIGCADSKDKHSALKMVTAVGVVMGLHAAYTLIFTDVDFTFQTMLTYLPRLIPLHIVNDDRLCRTSFYRAFDFLSDLQFIRFIGFYYQHNHRNGSTR